VLRGTGSRISTAAQQLKRELNRWTGLGARVDRRAPLSEDDPSPWGQWLSQPDKVTEREREIFQTGVDADNAGVELGYYRFDLALKRLANLENSSSSRRFTILDGRKLRLKVGETVSYRDRWGNIRHVRIDIQQNGPPRYFQISGGGRLRDGVPSLSSGFLRDFREVWYKASTSSPQGRPIHVPSSVNYSTLSLVAGTSGKSASEVTDESPSSVESLWRELVQERLLTIPDDLSSSDLLQFVEVLSTLRPPEAKSVFEKLLAKDPPLVVGNRLIKNMRSFGKKATAAYYLRMLDKKPSQDVLLAAVALCDLGEDRGLQKVLEILQEPKPPLLSSSWQSHALRGIEKYLRKKTPTGELNDKMLRFLAASLEQPYRKSLCFRVLQKLARTDFGYSEAIRRPGKARSEAMEKTTQKALLWIEEQLGRPQEALK
jgi:hypothetical protein